MKKVKSQEAISKLIAKISTSEFKQKVRERIAKENDQFREEDAALRTSRRQYLQTYNL